MTCNVETVNLNHVIFYVCYIFLIVTLWPVIGNIHTYTKNKKCIKRALAFKIPEKREKNNPKRIRLKKNHM